MTLEIEDKLTDCVEMAKAEIRELFEKYVSDNELTYFPEISDLDDTGDVHSIVDSCVPVYTWDIKVAWFLHESEIVTALENEGLLEEDGNPRTNDGMTGLYAYIYNEVRLWYNNEFKDAFEANEVLAWIANLSIGLSLLVACLLA